MHSDLNYGERHLTPRSAGSSRNWFFPQVDVAALCTASRDWMIAQIPGESADLDQLVYEGKTLRDSMSPPAVTVRPSLSR
jgi:hypothetical protein